MGKKLYGSIHNRFDEGHNFNKDGLLHAGDDITMYYWSDRICYYITKVIDQKHIFVHRYEVCADHSKPGCAGHQDWLYFKTIREEQEYLNSCHIKDLDGNDLQTDLDTIKEHSDEEWVFRYGKWREVFRYNLDKWEHAKQLAEKECKPGASEQSKYNLARYYFGNLPDEDFEKVMQGEEVVRYMTIQQGVSFGVRDYYYDWEF